MNPSENDNYFLVRDFKQTLADGKTRKVRRKICGAFLYENTTTLLFSRTNYGKSLLAFQFARAAATGSDIDPCPALCNQCEPMKVLVVDLELEDGDLYERHAVVLEDTDPCMSNLLYLHEKIDNQTITGIHLLDKIEQAAIAHQAKLVIIDNISKLLPAALKHEMAATVTTMLNRIRKITGCSILVIGHTTKGNPQVCIQPTDYYGSSMLQNFFRELSFLDATKDGNFFLCHSKTKRKESYTQTVPVFSRGQHDSLGVGFTFLSLQPLTDIQLPMNLVAPNKQRSRNLSKFRKEIAILLSNGFSQSDVADLCNVNQSTISRLLSSA
jgi:RecA-family ATPase